MFNKVQKLLSPDELKELYPIKKTIKANLDATVKNILDKKDSRRLLIAGPCSLDESGAFYAYLENLKVLQEKVEDKLLIVARLYTAKPRSRGGYVGLVHMPGGLTKCREIFSKAINEFNFPVADELLYPFMCDYFSDAVSYYAIGARSSLNQEHRFFASGVDCAVGLKNPLNGDLGALVDSVTVCKEKNTFFKGGYEVMSNGNNFAHGILRGYTDCSGAKISNFDAASVERYRAECAKRCLGVVPLIIDFSHDNSGKDYVRQLDTLEKVVQNMSLPEYAATVKGFMMESYLHEGKGEGFGYSLTDGCLSFEQTEEAVKRLCSKL